MSVERQGRTGLSQDGSARLSPAVLGQMIARARYRAEAMRSATAQVRKAAGLARGRDRHIESGHATMGTKTGFDIAPDEEDGKVCAWREPPSLTLDDQGRILDCSARAEEVFGYSRAQLLHQHVSMVLPEVAEMDLLKDGQPSAYFTFLCRIGYVFKMMPRSGAAILRGLSLVWLTGRGNRLVRLIVQA